MKLDAFRVFATLATLAVAALFVFILGREIGADSPPPPPPVVEADTGPQVVFLVRHAEKADDDPQDPTLTDVGHARAAELADRLASRGIERVLSTDFKRTRDTAAPLASRLGLRVELYDPRDLPGTAADIRADGRTTLVVGHSNTTPALVDALGGDPGEPIDESEYDRLYELTFAVDSPETVLHRFEVPAATPGG